MKNLYKTFLIVAALIFCGSAFAQDDDPVKQKKALDPVITESGIVQVVVKINESFGGTEGRGDFGIIAHDDSEQFDNWNSGLALAIIDYNEGSPILRGWNGALDTWGTDEKSLNLGDAFSLWFDMNVASGTYSIYVQGENDADVTLLGEENLIPRAVSKDYTPRDKAEYLTVAVNRRWNDLSVVDIVKEAEVVDAIEPYFLQVPFLGAPVTLPGTIMAVEYDKGGQDISYYDTSEENRGVALRGIDFRVNEWVDIDNHPDSGYVVGWTADGEWMEYTVVVPEAGSYDLDFHVASRNGGGLLGIDVDGEPLLSEISVPKTDDWTNYMAFTKRVNLKEGKQVWRFNFEKAGFNLHKLVVSEFEYPGPQVIFVDDFNQEPDTISSSGEPVVDYTIWTTVEPLEFGGGTAIIEEYAPKDGMLKLLAREKNPDQSGNRTEVSAPLSVFNQPFNPVLSSNEDTLVWAFTAKQNRNSAGGTNGFNGTQTGMAVVLASDSSMWGSQQGSNAKGYAVTFLKPEESMYCVSLSRFDGGLSNYTVILGNKATDVFSEFRTWVTVKVTYVPATNEWSLFFRDEASQDTKGDVYYTEGLNLIETVVDDTFTDLEMSHFGFALNTPTPGATGADGNAFWVDDFVVAMGNLESPISRFSINTSVTENRGTIDLSPDQSDYVEGSEVQLTAIPADGFDFESWSGDVTGNENPLIITVDSNMEIRANFSATYTLEIKYDEEVGAVNRNPLGDEFMENTTVTLIADPKAGYTFDGWSGDASGNQNPLIVTMDSHKVITATFSPIVYYTLNVSFENGVVSQAPLGNKFEEYTEVRLNAIALPGFVFESWSGDVTSTENPLMITMDSNLDITANFVPVVQYFTLDITSENGSVDQSIQGTEFAENTEIELTANPDDGYKFESWSGDVTGTDNPVTVTIVSNMNVTANFTPTTSISEYVNGLSIYPNPSNGIFAVQVEQPVSYRVYGISGILLKSGEESGSFNLDMRNYNDAIYILQIESQEGVSFKRIMKVSQ